MLAFFIFLPARSAVVKGDKISTGKLHYVPFGRVYFHADSFFSKGWTVDKGDLVLNIRNGRIKNKTGTIVVLASEIDLRLPLSSLFRLKFVPKIERMKGVRVFVDASVDKKPPAGSKKKPFRSISESVSFLQEIVILSSIQSNESSLNHNIIEDAEFNFVFGADVLNVKIEDATLQERSIQNAESVARGLNFNSVIKANILVNGERSFADISCVRGLDGRPGCVVISNAQLGRYINQFVRTRNGDPFFDFGGLVGEIKAFFGSYFRGKVHFFVDGHLGSVVKLFNGRKLFINPIKSRVLLDIKKKELVLFPFNLEIIDFTKGSFGMIINFEDTVKKFFTFDAHGISNKNAIFTLQTIREANGAMNNVIKGIFDNVVFMGGEFDVKKSLIESSGRGKVFSDVNVDFHDGVFQVKPVNNIMVMDVAGSLNISGHLSKMVVNRGKIGNDFFDNVSVTFYYNPSSEPRVDVSFDANSLQVGNIFYNKAMPLAFKKVIQWLKVRYGAIIAGRITSSLILSKAAFVDRFEINGGVRFSDLHNPFATTHSSPITLNFNKRYRSPDLVFDMDFGDSEIMYGSKDVVIKKSKEAMRAEGNLKDFFLPGDKFSIENLRVYKKLNGVSSVVLDGSFNSALKDAKIISFDANVKKFLLLDNDFASSFALDKDGFYSLRIEGEKANWQELYKAMKYHKSDDANPILRLKLKAQIDLDRLKMFNMVEMRNVAANLDVSEGVFRKLAISSDVMRVDAEERAVPDWGYLNDEHVGPEFPLVLVAEKGPRRNRIHGYFENARMLFDAFNMDGFYHRFSGGSLSINGHQNAAGIVADVDFKHFFYYPDNAFSGNFTLADKAKGMDIEDFFCVFDYDLNRRILNVKKGKIQSRAINSVGAGYIDFISRQLYFTGKLDVFTKKTGGFGIENVPVVGRAVSMSMQKRRPLFSFSYVVDGSLDNMRNAVKIRPSKSMFALISFGGAFLAFGLGLLLALI